jgi:hypothetical protein
MACVLSISSVTQDSAGSIHIAGTGQGSIDPKIIIKVTCGSQSYSVAAVISAAGTWSEVIQHANACGCGQPITVVATVSSDPTCNVTFTSSSLCCCPTVITTPIYGSCTGSTELVTFDTTVSIGEPCSFTFRRDFGDGAFGMQYALTGPGTFNLGQEPHSYAAPGTYTSSFDVISPVGCGALDPLNVVVSCGACHSSSLTAVWCEIMEFIFLLSASVGFVLTLANTCTLPAVILTFVGIAILALLGLKLLKCDKCVCAPWQKFLPQIILIAGIILFMFIPPNCCALVGPFALAFAIGFVAYGYLGLNTWYTNNKSTCPLLICDLWCTIGGLLNPRACTNLAILGSLIVAATNPVLLPGLGISLFVAVSIGFIANGPLTTTPCNNTTRKCQ